MNEDLNQEMHTVNSLNIPIIKLIIAIGALAIAAPSAPSSE